MIHITTFRADNMGAEITEGNGILAALDLSPGNPPLALLVDMQELNSGASLTNLAERAVTHVGWLFSLDASQRRAATWVETDSCGNFDAMTPVRRSDGTASSILWSPLRAERVAPRTLEAFLLTHGQRGAELWARAIESLGAIARRRRRGGGDEPRTNQGITGISRRGSRHAVKRHDV